MVELTVKILGLEQLKANSAQYLENLNKELVIGLDASGRQIAADAKRSIMSGSKSGRVYKLRTVSHRASAPGEAPANNTGRLVNSIVSEIFANKLEAVVSAGKGVAKYAVMLELGTIRMAARPFFFPAAEKNKEWIRTRIQTAVNRAAEKNRKK